MGSSGFSQEAEGASRKHGLEPRLCFPWEGVVRQGREVQSSGLDSLNGFGSLRACRDGV